MAHELESGFFGGNKAAWHGLGTVLAEDTLKSDRALVEAGLNWKVDLVPHYTPAVGAEGEWIMEPVDGHFHVKRDRDGRVLGSVGARYNPLQNHDAFTFGDDLVDSGEAKWHTAGALKNGQVVWMLMKLPQDIQIAGMESETIEPYVLISNSHDGSSAVTAAITPIRVVCQNTLSLALGQTKRKFKIRHTKNMHGKLSAAREMLGITFSYLADLEKTANGLVEAKMDTSDINAFLDTLLPVPDEDGRGKTVAENRQQLIRTIHNNAPNLQNIKGTRWGVLNAVIEANDHHATVREQKHNPADVRFERLVSGGGLVQEAYSLLAV